MRFQFTWQMALSTVAVGVFAVGCAGSRSEFQLNRAEPVLGAEAELELSEEANGNTEVGLEVRNLRPASELRENAKTYVVWAQDPLGGEAFNLGALDVGSSGRGELESLTPLKKFDLFVTAEPTAAAVRPSGERAMWASVAQQ
jgi:hypothetical protein